MGAFMQHGKIQLEVRFEGGPSASAAPAGILPSSSSSNVSAGTGEEDQEPRLLELPKDCIVRVLLASSVLDTCSVARVCRSLREVADSDEVWLPRLPPDPVINPPTLSKKDLYFRLRARMLHKDFSQPYWLDPITGEGCFVKSARDLVIERVDDPRYWHWESQPDSWFSESAYLHNVCWFDVRGEFESVFYPGTYTLSFRIGFTDALRGWAGFPVKLSLSTSNGELVESQRFFSGKRTPLVSKAAPLRSVGVALSSWMELDAGEFHVEREMRVKVQACMLEVEGGQRKAGIVLDGIKIQLSSAISKDSYV